MSLLSLPISPLAPRSICALPRSPYAPCLSAWPPALGPITYSSAIWINNCLFFHRTNNLMVDFTPDLLLGFLLVRYVMLAHKQHGGKWDVSTQRKREDHQALRLQHDWAQCWECCTPPRSPAKPKEINWIWKMDDLQNTTIGINTRSFTSGHDAEELDDRWWRSGTGCWSALFPSWCWRNEIQEMFIFVGTKQQLRVFHASLADDWFCSFFLFYSEYSWVCFGQSDVATAAVNCVLSLSYLKTAPRCAPPSAVTSLSQCCDSAPLLIAARCATVLPVTS